MRAAGAAALACATTLAQPQPDAGPTATQVQQVIDQDLQRLAAKLNDPQARQEDRDEAARRLISRRRPEATKLVGDALVNLNPGGQLAAARALASDTDPDPVLINPLFAALGVNRPLTEAAAAALASYKDNPEVLSRLIAFVQNRPPADLTRVLVVRAIGAIPQKRSAEFLLNLLRKADEAPVMRTAAAEALGELSGLGPVGETPEQWEPWWRENSSKPDAEFRADLLNRQSARHERVREQYARLGAELAALLKEQYRASSTAQRQELMLRYLRSTEPQVRALAVDIVLDEVTVDNKRPTDAVLEQLRALIGDSSPIVRASVASALGSINDAASFEPLLAQLAQEPEPGVRALLAQALGPINDVRAAPVLLRLLGDPSLAAAAAAARALEGLGPDLRQKDPALASQVASALRDTLERRTGTPQTVDLRQRLVAAMVPLRQESLLPLLTGMLDERRGETPEVRSLAIRAIGEIADPRSAGVLVASLDSTDARIRLEVVQALAKSPAMAEYAETLRNRLDPRTEPEESVRNAAWRALESVFPSLPPAQLNAWAERFRDDPSRRLIALKALAQLQLRDKDEDNLATTRTQIAEVLVAQKEYKEAADFYGLVLDYKRTQPVQGAVIESLVEARMKSLLESRDFAAATAFAAESIGSGPPDRTQVMGGLIWKKAQELRDAPDLQAALDLIAAAGKMAPPLSQDYRDRLATVEREVQQRKTQQNGARPLPGPRTASSSNGRV